MTKQRGAHAAGTLTRERADQLNALGFLWATPDTWERGFAVYESWMVEKGDPHVPGLTVHKDFKLGTWVSTQRQAHGQGRLAPQRFDRLDSVGFIWDAKDLASNTKWEKGYASFVSWVREMSDPHVPTGTEHDGFGLGNWVSRQRVAYRSGALSRARIARLDAIGFVWDGSARRGRIRRA